MVSNSGSQRNVDPRIAAAARRRRRRNRIGVLIAFIVIVAAVGAYVPLTLLATPASATAKVAPLTVKAPANVALALPDIGESAVSVTGAGDIAGTSGTNGILASSGGSAALPIASISKLITALVVLEAKPIAPGTAGPTITFTAADAALYDKYYVLQATIQPMKAGSTMSEHDALEVMLIVSACNYSEAVATWAYGSDAKFLAAVTTWLKKNNLSGTTIKESTGLDARNTSTPSDLIAIGKLALANPVIANIVQTQSLDIPPLPQQANTNQLLGVSGISGIKTGSLEEAGACLLFSATMDIGTGVPITVVGIVLGGKSHGSVDVAVKALLASIKAGFHVVPLIKAGDAVGTMSTPWNANARIVAARTAKVLTWSSAPITSKTVTRKVTTAASGADVGSITFVSGTTSVSVPLVLDGAIGAPSSSWRLTHPLELLG